MTLEILFAILLRQAALRLDGNYSYTTDDTLPGNWLVWDEASGGVIYDANSQEQAMAITALLNMGLPYQWEAIGDIVDFLEPMLKNPAVQQYFKRLDEADEENRQESL